MVDWIDDAVGQPSGRRRIERALRAGPESRQEEIVEQLARQAAQGNFDAASCLASAIKTCGLARRTLRQYLFTDQDVDVAEVAVLIAVAYRIGSFSGRSKFTTWLHTVSRNEARQLLRSEARHVNRAVAQSDEQDSEHFVTYVSSMVADRAVVAREIAQLRAKPREALLLREEHGLTYDEIAARLDIPLSTAKSRVRRARAALADRLADHLTLPQQPEVM